MTNARTARQERERKAAELRAAAARKQARQRSILVTVAALAVLAIAVGVFAIVKTAQQEQAAASGGTPGNFTTGNGVIVGNTAAPVTLVAYEDFQCPACRNFEETNKSQLDKWIADGTVKVEYRPISFLDSASKNQYSSRALNMVAAVVNVAPDKFKAVHDKLYANQPEEQTAGPSNEELIQLAVSVGVSEDSIADAVNKNSYSGWVKTVTETASKDGVNSTPTLRVNGKTLDTYDPASIKAAVEAAVKAAASTPTTTSS